MERTANHPGTVGFQPIVVSGLSDYDSRLDCFKNVHLRNLLDFFDNFFICLNIRRKTLSTEKSGTSASKAKSRPENLHFCKSQDGSVHTKLVDIVPQIEYN